MDGLVLDVGAGSCPSPRSDVLLDRHVSGEHRHGAGLVVDRPLVYADALRMPFRDKAFEFVVASHVMEHIPKPEVFLQELMRVGKAGYIETPNAIFERMSPYTTHCLEIMSIENKLVIHKKSDPVQDPFFRDLQIIVKNKKWKKLFVYDVEMFHVRYFWRDTIQFEIVNPDEQCDWYEIDNPNKQCNCMEDVFGDDAGLLEKTYSGSGWRGWGLRNLRKYYRWRRRKPIEWLDILACPECKGALSCTEDFFVCPPCRRIYRAKPHPNFISYESSSLLP